MPLDVDYKIMLTFLEFYETLLGFLDFNLYKSIYLKYPPILDSRLKALAIDLYALTRYVDAKDRPSGTNDEESEHRLAQLQDQLPSNEPCALMNLVVNAAFVSADEEETRACKSLFQNKTFFLGHECKLFPLMGKVSTVSVFLGFGLTFAGSACHGEHNIDFHPMVDFVKASPFSPKSTGFNEFSSNIATALVCLATNRTYNFSKLIFDGLVKDVNNKISKFLMYPRFLTMCFRMTQFGQISHIQKYVGEGSGTLTEPHYIPSPEAQPSSHTHISSPSLPTVTTISTALIPTVTSSKITPLRQYTQRARIAQSSALPLVEDEPASPVRDVSQGEACPTESGFIVDQDRTIIAKSSTLPYDSATRVTSPAAVEGSTQQTINELTNFYTSLQRQHSELRARFQEVKINKLKERVKLLEDGKGMVAEGSGDDAPIKGRRLDEEVVATERVSSDTEEIRLDEGEVAAKKVSDDTKEMVTILITMDAASVLSSRGVQVVPTDAAVAPANESAKKQKTTEEVPEEVKSCDDIPEEKIKELIRLVPIEEVYVEALQVKHPIIDWKGRIVRNKMQKAFPLPVTEFPLPEKKDATARRKEKPLLERSYCYQWLSCMVIIVVMEKLLRPQLVGFGDLKKLLLNKNNIDDKGYWDSGCSRHITRTLSYLSEYEPYDEGYVSFGQGGGKITGKGIIKTGKLEFEIVYFVKELKYNLFSVSQICDNKNSVLFTDSECIVLGKSFKLKDDINVLLMTPRQHNMYSIDLNNTVPHKNLTYLVAKASVDESMLWHRRLGHLNFKIMNKLVRNNLVKGLPSKYFENYHICVACLKGKQHKASCKTKLVNSISKLLHTVYMDMFGPTSVSSLNHKCVFGISQGFSFYHSLRLLRVVITLEEPIINSFQHRTHDEQMFDADQDLEKAQQEGEANITLIESWDDVQTKIDADYPLAERLQAEEQQELNDEEKAKLTELVEESSKKAKEVVTEGSFKRARTELEQESVKK
uniref:Ribonuclease H-like domain-containing protein n=1 Tax=Tanacetum cinerariifolium TaxID=118510 RepID=A0A6L2MSN8_TANCI|nr:ribonuclease H-like domain-containing protein [Tanacetum cinerariifolium]